MQPVHLWQESNHRLRSQALGGNCQKATGNIITTTTENLTTNAKVRLRIRVQTGKDLVLPDMLSRAPLPKTAHDNIEEEIALHVHLVASSLPVSKSKLEEFREGAANY